LYGKTARAFGSVPGYINESYTLASTHGGNNEIWFTREKGVSFNPRAARIAVILLEGNRTTTPEYVALAVLSSLLAYTDSSKYISSWNLSNTTLTEKFIMMQKEHAFTLKNGNEPSAEFAEIYISLFIDKMRHVHLSRGDNSALIRETLEECRYYIMLSAKYFPYYKPFITHWMNRFIRYEDINTGNE
jgi:hypothetical protein